MLIIFDVEGVLLNAEYLPVLAQLMGPEKEKEIWDITKQGIRGEINWEEGLSRRVADSSRHKFGERPKNRRESSDYARCCRTLFCLEKSRLENDRRFWRLYSYNR